jgi:ADP-heptose:LPS heptosyltransferase
LLQPVLETSGCEFWNLAGGVSRAEWEELEDNGNLHEAAFCANSIVKLAALVAQLDLIITSDTLAVHLAGALGTPAWLLLEYAADWRWQQTRSDSPWYPSLRLFRQKRRGCWEDVVRDVQGALYAHLWSRNHSSRVA